MAQAVTVAQEAPAPALQPAEQTATVATVATGAMVLLGPQETPALTAVSDPREVMVARVEAPAGQV